MRSQSLKQLKSCNLLQKPLFTDANSLYIRLEVGGLMTRTGKRLSPEARREQLIDAAIACYGELGVERAGHGDIAKRVNVSTATVFNYFGTRESLTESVFTAVYDVFRDMFSTIPHPGGTAEQHIQSLAVSYDFLIDQHPDVSKVVLNWSASFGATVRPQYLDFQDWVLHGIQRRLHQPSADRSDARMVLAAAYSYAAMRLDNTPDEVMARFVARIVKAVA